MILTYTFGFFLLLSVALMLWFTPSPKSRYFLTEKTTVSISYTNYFAATSFIFTILFALSVAHLLITKGN